jgi:hypothetical protein
VSLLFSPLATLCPSFCLYALPSSAVDIDIDLVAGLGVTFPKLVTFDLDNQVEESKDIPPSTGESL